MDRRGLIARLALIPFGLVLAVLGLELAFRVGSLAVTSGAASEDSSGRGSQRQILCLGDSNTYGLWLEERERESYPAQLQALWDASPLSPAEIRNLGYPGTNSSQILAHLPDWLDAIGPEHVVLMVGVNDYWTIPLHGGGANSSQFLQQHSRIYRALYLMVQRARLSALTKKSASGTREVPGTWSGVAEVEGQLFEMGWDRAEAPDAARGEELANNLERIIELARAQDAQVTLMTYPSNDFLYNAANEVLRRVADQTSTSMVDLQAAFAPLCAQRECPEWLYEDQHPRAKGYTRVAEILLAALTAREATGPSLSPPE